MGRYDKYGTVRGSKPKPWNIHPIWRGIGCLMMILIPIMAYAGSVLLVEANNINQWLTVPPFLKGPNRDPYLYAEIAATLFLSFIGFGGLVFLYSIVYRLFGPPRYGAFDAPPPRRRPKRRAR